MSKKLTTSNDDPIAYSVIAFVVVIAFYGWLYFMSPLLAFVIGVLGILNYTGNKMFK